MDLHVALPNGQQGVTLEQLVEVAEAAEELGFAGIWPLDHILVGPDLKDRYPWVIEPLTLLAYLATRTHRIRLGTSIVVLGLRNPFVVAKQAATLDLLCAGRFTLGLGAGYSEPEFRNVGAAGVWHTRGKRLDEAIELFRHLWSGSKHPFHGQFYPYEDGWFGPLPPQGASLPIMIGGSSDGALRRAAKYADMWQSTRLNPQRFKERVGVLRTLAGDRRIDVGARTTLSDGPRAMRDTVQAFEAAGANHVCAYFTNRLEDFVPAMRACALEVMPALR